MCSLGYVPLRVGHERLSNNANDENEPPVGCVRESLLSIHCLTSCFSSAHCPSMHYCHIHRISLDTLLWTEKLLEDRLTELNSWTRRSPPTQRQKLDRINWLLNRCNNN